MPAAVGVNFSSGCAVQHHGRNDCLTPVRIRYTEDGTVCNARMHAQYVFNFRRKYIDSVADNNVLFAPGNILYKSALFISLGFRSPYEVFFGVKKCYTKTPLAVALRT